MLHQQVRSVQERFVMWVQQTPLQKVRVPLLTQRWKRGDLLLMLTTPFWLLYALVLHCHYYEAQEDDVHEMQHFFTLLALLPPPRGDDAQS